MSAEAMIFCVSTAVFESNCVGSSFGKKVAAGCDAVSRFSALKMRYDASVRFLCSSEPNYGGTKITGMRTQQSA